MKKKIARTLLVIAALGTAIVPFTPNTSTAGPCSRAGCVGNQGYCTTVTIIDIWKVSIDWECNGQMMPEVL
jgi:hypothetical protein